MERKVYILGTSHKYQRHDDTCEPNSVNEFRQYLTLVCKNYSIKAIGEEMSQEALEIKNRKISIPKIFTQEHSNLEHRYCDPDREEQIEHGIRESGFFSQGKKFPEILQPQEVRNLSQEEADELEWKEDQKREPVWLNKILEFNTWPLLYICGPKHVESFGNLLHNESFDVEIVSNHWKP